MQSDERCAYYYAGLGESCGERESNHEPYLCGDERCGKRHHRFVTPSPNPSEKPNGSSSPEKPDSSPLDATMQRASAEFRDRPDYLKRARTDPASIHRTVQPTNENAIPPVEPQEMTFEEWFAEWFALEWAEDFPHETERQLQRVAFKAGYEVGRRSR